MGTQTLVVPKLASLPGGLAPHRQDEGTAGKSALKLSPQPPRNLAMKSDLAKEIQTIALTETMLAHFGPHHLDLPTATLTIDGRNFISEALKLDDNSKLSDKLDVLALGSLVVRSVTDNDADRAVYNIAAGTEQLFAGTSKILTISELEKLSKSLLQVAYESRVSPISKKLRKKVFETNTIFEHASTVSILAQGGGYFVSRMNGLENHVVAALKASADASRSIGLGLKFKAEIDDARVALQELANILDFLYYNNGFKHEVPNLSKYKRQGLLADGMTAVGNLGFAAAQALQGNLPMSLAFGAITAAGEMSAVEVRAKVLAQLGEFIDNVYPIINTSPASTARGQNKSISTIPGYQIQQQEIAIRNLVRSITCGVFNDAVYVAQTAEAYASNRIQLLLDEKFDVENFVKQKIALLKMKQVQWNVRAIGIMQMLDDIGNPTDPGGIFTLVKQKMEKSQISEYEAVLAVEDELQSRIMKNCPNDAFDRLSAILTSDDAAKLENPETVRSLLNDYSLATYKPFYIAKYTPVEECATVAEEIGIPGFRHEGSVRSIALGLIDAISKNIIVKELLSTVIKSESCQIGEAIPI